MTSAVRRTSDRRPGGFTLLEIIIVLALSVMIIGGAAGMMYFNRDEARLNNAVGEVEVLAKRARSLATLQQKPYALEFTAHQVNLLPYAEALMDPNDRDYYLQAAVEREGEIAPVTSSFVVDDDLMVLVRRWATGTWQPVERQDRQIWRFDPQGICEPLGVRLETQNGNWIAVLFHPLTAAVAESESEIR
ncbi:prepilin-type N-terminal cleavage/methylation domain-containing protein [Haloferula luteola]|uniref:Prepilin-type N-terminal cleavage/methylation domain-containing protein n=1 Tax=Haloferula luteola TaxID=595692 RepID=A0A840V2N5_9BACT|nr:prepilin-type N-terminal cleavage/methylation domain-containing protein [Haloferula luteola]MBB5352252.1 prepilin-type N-terminal cleavage/methylation domain-containing protein [Haloferula luteola]